MSVTLDQHDHLSAGESGVADRRAVERVPVDSLLPADSPRLAGEDEEHARALAETTTGLPPIQVHRQTRRVIDGAHRVMAAKLRGQTVIDVHFFDGCEDDAFVEAVRANVRHGKPLTLVERQRAAERMLHSHPEWSDRALADACALSSKTIGALRRRATGEVPQLHTRVGRDGRSRPVDSTSRRQRAAELLAANPGASLRTVANAVGISAGTVRDVRARVRRGANPVPRRSAEAADSETRRSRCADALAALKDLQRDASLRSTDIGRAFLAWGERTVVGSVDWQNFVSSIPLSRVFVVAEFARSCSAVWAEFASALEARGQVVKS